MHPYSIEMESPHAAKTVPASHTNRVRPTLPVDLTIDPGVAKMPLPITRDTTRMYALDQLRLFPWLGPGRLSGKPSVISVDVAIWISFWRSSDSSNGRVSPAQDVAIMPIDVSMPEMGFDMTLGKAIIRLNKFLWLKGNLRPVKDSTF